MTLCLFSITHTHKRTCMQRHTDTHPRGTLHSMLCIKVCFCVFVDVCLSLCAVMPNEHLLVSLAQRQHKMMREKLMRAQDIVLKMLVQRDKINLTQS